MPPLSPPKLGKPISLVDQYGVAYGTPHTEGRPHVIIADANGLLMEFQTDQSGSVVAMPVVQVNTQHFQLSRRLMRFTGTKRFPSIASSAWDTSLTFGDTSGFVVGNEVFVYDTTTNLEEPDAVKITAIAAGVVTFDGPLENAYTTAATMELVSTSLSSLAGTLAAPQTYKISPLPTEEWHIDRIIIHLEDTSGMDDQKFGSAPALTNGVTLFKTFNGVNSRLGNWKSNGDFTHTCYDTKYVSKSGGGLFAFSGRWSFFKHQVAHEVVGANGDLFGALVQDDITSVEHMHIIVQGHRDIE